MLTTLKELKKIRLEKLKAIKDSGLNPYLCKSGRSHLAKQAVDDFDKIVSSGVKVILAGRIRSIRGHGGSTFGHIEDVSGKVQFYLKKDVLGEKKYKFFLNNIDIGDFIELEGTLFKTKKGEKTLQVSSYKVLTKSLLTLPEKWHGLKDVEERFRKRYLDLLMASEVRDRFVLRAKLINEVRRFLYEQGFLEVETPILEHIPGGADAKPFVTHHETLDIDLYLRISLELHLKRLIVGGFEKIFEVGRVFRNEGISREHLQEFTLLELYFAYKDYNDLMKFVEEFYATVIKNIIGALKIKYRGKIIDFTPPWKRVDYREIFKDRTGIDLKNFKDEKDASRLKKEARDKNIEVEETFGLGRLIDQIYKRKVRGEFWEPSFLINHPVIISPLAKRKEDDSEITERFQILVAGTEVGNGFSELNDPQDQRSRFESQMKLREAGDEEAHIMDEDFIQALEYGMPPTTGFGVSIDRLFMILADLPNIKEGVLFPLMRPK